MIHGLLPVDKPLGLTSHDVVARVRRLAGQKQVGHAGTLDPLATGVLVILLGNATRLSSYVMHAPKVYCAEVVLGATTVTDDAEGPVQSVVPVEDLTDSQIRAVLPPLTGIVQQVPPRYAAIKKGGEKLYVLARQGVEVELQPRQVTISRLDLISWDPPRLRLRVACGSGTYIRSLARDIGAVLNVGGYLHALRRVASGGFDLSCCTSLDSLAGVVDVRDATLPADRALPNWPAVVLNRDEAKRVCTGQTVPLHEAEGDLRLYDRDGTLLGLGRVESGRLRPFRIFSGG